MSSAVPAPVPVSAPDVVCVGEVLVDFVPDGTGAFHPRAGGAPANVAAALASLGRTAAMISAVGDDWLGVLITAALGEHGVDTAAVQRDGERPTGVAVVTPPGSRGADFVIHRATAADAHLALHEQERSLIRRAGCVHLSSMLSASPAGARVHEEVATATAGTAVLSSFDVNLRPSVWPSAGDMLTATRHMIAAADVVKVTEEELRQLGLEIEPRRAEGRLWLITDGAVGARLVTPRLQVRRDVRPAVVVDATGAGDATLATLLDSVLGSVAADDAGAWDAEDVEHALDRAMRVGAHVVQQSGAMSDLSGFRVPAPSRQPDAD